MQVRELMSDNPACCTSDSTLQEVARMMVENDCGCIPVVNDLTNRKPVGTITDRDIAIRTVAAGQNPVPMKASDIMSIDIATVKPDQSLEECLKAMEEKDIRRILVVDEEGKCCGIVAQADIVENSINPVRTAEYLREVSESSPSHNMTLSRDWQSRESSFNVGPFLPILVGLGSGAALSYFLGKQKNYRRKEAWYQPQRQFTAHRTNIESHVNNRQHNSQNRFEETGTETHAQTVTANRQTNARFEIKLSSNGKFHFNLKSGNGETILSSELYNSRNAAENGVESVKKNAADAKRFERKVNSNGKSYFVLKAGNGEVIGMSETFSSQTAMENSISSVMRNAPFAAISTTAV
jgi:uncharacterized protein YegP (UPF0339 family)/CBS domain-containing protein